MDAFEGPPGLVAYAAGPYAILQGQSITLSGQGASDGIGWANAFTNLSDALAVALPGQTLRVATGTSRSTPTSFNCSTSSLRAGWRTGSSRRSRTSRR